MSPSLADIWAAEADQAIQHTAERLAQDLFRSDPVMKIYSEGADNAEPTWIGKCKTCGWRYVTNLHWPSRSKMPDACDRPRSGVMQGYVCGGEVELDPNSEALLAVFLLNGYDAIQEGPRERVAKIHGLEGWLP